MAVVRISQPVLTDDEIATAMRRDGKAESEVDFAIAEREANRRALQQAYDTKPPSVRYQEV